MVQATQSVMEEILDRARTLNAREKLKLAVCLLQQVQSDTTPLQEPTGSIADLIGSIAMPNPPTDEEVERILEEELIRKHLK